MREGKQLFLPAPCRPSSSSQTLPQSTQHTQSPTLPTINQDPPALHSDIVYSACQRIHTHTPHTPVQPLKLKMASKPQVNGAPKMNGVATKKAAPTRAPVKRATPKPAQKARPVQNKAASVAGGDNYANGVGGAYAIMASRIANRVAEMAESITFVER
jgi:hypothetical protein